MAKILHGLNVEYSGNGGTVTAKVSQGTVDQWPEESFSLSFVGGTPEMLRAVQTIADKVGKLKKNGS